jgi:hypothetical protein
VAATTQAVEHGGELEPERWALGLPKSASDIEAIHQAKKALAVERAKQSKFLGKRLSGIDARKLDDPEEWSKIPVLTKDELRKLSTDEFYGDFCIAGFDRAVEFWRSGGATGKPLFYPRSAQDMRYMLGVSFRRIWPCIGAGPGDVVHVASRWEYTRLVSSRHARRKWKGSPPCGQVLARPHLPTYNLSSSSASSRASSRPCRATRSTSPI